MAGSLAEARVSDEKISPRDAAELAECFAAHARDLFGYACVVARGDRALADDLVQAAFEAAGRAWWSLRCLAEDQRRGWLRATLANIAVSGFRRDAAFRDRMPRIEARYRPAAADTAAPAERSVLVSVLQALPPRQREVLVLRYYADLSEAQIASTMGISRGAVRSHTARAMSALHAQLRRADDGASAERGDDAQPTGDDDAGFQIAGKGFDADAAGLEQA